MDEREVVSWDPYESFQAFLHAPAYHLAIEGCLIIWVLWLIFHKSYKPEPELTEKEKDDLIREWQPEALVPPTPEDHYALNPRIVTSKVGKRVTVDGKDCLNMATHNYLGLVQNELLEKSAIKGLEKYGVGSCGPRGFYGTVDIHLELENKLAKFMQVEEAVLYSYGFSTVASAIPAYAKSSDVIFVDEGVHFAIQQGLRASRSRIKYFKHNDVDDLHRLLLEQAEEDRRNPKKAKVTRRFLVVEGLYMNYGDICPLKEMVKLKNQFKVRIFVDETVSFGVLGRTGRGISEEVGVPVDEIDHFSASLENAISAYGGFCCGTSFIVDHQRLSGWGYCFSASLPPLQAAVAISALDVLETNPGILEQLRDNCRYIHKKLKQIPTIHVEGVDVSPIKHLRFSTPSSDGKKETSHLESVSTPSSDGKKETSHLESVSTPSSDRKKETSRLESVVNYAWNEHVAITVARYLDDREYKCPEPSIRLTVNSALTKSDMDTVVQVLSSAFDSLA